jgi:hypothetical protein
MHQGLMTIATDATRFLSQIATEKLQPGDQLSEKEAAGVG